MKLEEFKELINKLDNKEICDLFTDNKNCEQCFCQTKDKECIITIFSEGMLDEIGNK